MKKSLNPSPTEREVAKRCYDFKRYLNVKYKLNLYLYDLNLYGFDMPFRMWLSLKCGIVDFEKHLQKIESEFNPLNHYKSLAIRDYVIVNR